MDLARILRIVFYISFGLKMYLELMRFLKKQEYQTPSVPMPVDMLEDISIDGKWMP